VKVGISKRRPLLLFIGFAVFSSSVVPAQAWQASRVDCGGELVVRSHLESEIHFLAPSIQSASSIGLPDSLKRNLPRISEVSSRADRLQVLKDFPLAKLVANPGHRVLRDPKLVEEIAKNITDGLYRVDHSAKGPAMNIVTDVAGKIESVDLWEGHHRFLAQYVAGRKLVGQLPADELKIFVNGELPTDADFKFREHLIPSAGANLLASILWSPLLPPEIRDPGQTYRTRPDPLGEDKNGDIIVSRKNSNQLLGSAETLEDVRQNVFRSWQPRVGIFVIGLSQPLPDFERLKQLAIHKLRSDVVLVWLDPKAAISQVDLDKIQTWNLNHDTRRPYDHPFLNVYRGVAVQAFSEKHNFRSFQKRIQQIYATTNPAEVISFGDDEE